MLFYSCSFACDIKFNNEYVNDFSPLPFNEKCIFVKSSNLDKQYPNMVYSSLCNKDSSIKLAHNNNFNFSSPKQGTITVQAVAPEGEYSNILFRDNYPVEYEKNKMNVFFKLNESDMFSANYNIQYKAEGKLGQLCSLIVPLNKNVEFPIASEKSSFRFENKETQAQ